MKKISDEFDVKANTELSSPERRTFVKGTAAIGAGVAAFPLLAEIAESQVPESHDNEMSSGASHAPLAFRGDKIDWHGFDRYDFVMDKETLALSPFKAPTIEQSGDVGSSDLGKLRCVVVVPQKAAPGNPWSWRGVYSRIMISRASLTNCSPEGPLNGSFWSQSQIRFEPARACCLRSLSRFALRIACRRWSSALPRRTNSFVLSFTWRAERRSAAGESEKQMTKRRLAAAKLLRDLAGGHT